MNKTMKSLDNQNRLIECLRSTISSQHAQNEAQANDLCLILGSTTLRALDHMNNLGFFVNVLNSNNDFTGTDREYMDALLDIHSVVPHECLTKARTRMADTLLRLGNREKALEKKKAETECPNPKKMASNKIFGRKKRNHTEAASKDAASTSKLPNSGEAFQVDMEEIQSKKIPSKRNRKKITHGSSLNLEENFTVKKSKEAALMSKLSNAGEAFQRDMEEFQSKKIPSERNHKKKTLGSGLKLEENFTVKKNIVMKKTESASKMRSTSKSVNKVTSEEKTKTDDPLPKKMASSTERAEKINRSERKIEDTPSTSKLQNLDNSSEQAMEEVPSTKLPSIQNSKKKAQKRKQKAQANENFLSDKEIAIKKTEPIKKMRNTSNPIYEVTSEDKNIETEDSAPKNMISNIELGRRKNNPREIISDAPSFSKLPNLDKTSEQDIEETSSKKLSNRQNSRKKVQADDSHLSLNSENVSSNKKTSMKKMEPIEKMQSSSNSNNEVISEDKNTNTNIEDPVPKNEVSSNECEKGEKYNEREITKAAPSTSKLSSRQNYKKKAQKRKKKAQANESSSSSDNVSSNKKILMKEIESLGNMQRSYNSNNIAELKKLIVTLSDFMIDPSADENQYVAQYKQQHCSKSNEKKEVDEANDVYFKDAGE